MNRYINLKWRPFKVDMPSFIEWLSTTYGAKYQGMSSNLGFCNVLVSAAFSSDDEAAMRAHFSGLTEGGEAAKLALPSRLDVSAKAARDQLIKSVIAGKTWDTMSTAERKFAMGVSVTNAEYDALAIS